MGLIAAGLNAIGGMLACQWKEYFYVDAFPDDVLSTKAMKKTKGRFGGSRTEDDNIISEGSVIAVADGQCMLIVDQGKIVDFCAELGEYVFEQGGEPSLFYGAFDGDKARTLLKETFDRFSFGGQADKDQRVYFFNTKEILGNKYGTPSPVPFRVVDQNIGLDIDVSIRCFGEYSHRITNPMLFYANVCGNVEGDLQSRKDRQPAQERAAHRTSARFCQDLRNGHSLQRTARSHDGNRRGAQRGSFRKMGEPARRGNRVLRRELCQGFRGRRGHDQGAAAQRRFPQHEYGGGAMIGFMGMNMAQGSGMNAAQLLQMGAQQPQQSAQPSVEGWKCTCGATATGKFCPECGSKKPEPKVGWKCSCGATVTGKFCPECGDVFDDGDIRG